MALPKSSISHVCKAVADFISDGLQASAHSIRILIGNPADAAPAQTETQHRINLFFYRFEPMEFQADSSPGDIWWLRLHCLITAFGIAEDQISAGENDLRLIGELMRVFHETPVLNISSEDEEHFQLQIVFQPLSADVMNHIWSTQNEVSYRPSVAYEMAVAPVVPKKPKLDSPLTGQIGYEVHAGMDGPSESSTAAIITPYVSTSVIDTSTEDWAPVICFVYEEKCSVNLIFEKDSGELARFQPKIWVAGKPGTDVHLAWEIWNHQGGWQYTDETVQTSASTPAIEPDNIATAQTVTVDLPAGNDNYQAVLYATRTYQRGVDGREISIRSNPLLVTVYKGT